MPSSGRMRRLDRDDVEQGAPTLDEDQRRIRQLGIGLTRGGNNLGR